jgi:hypothetical protein
MAIRYADEQIDAATRRLAEIDRELANLQRQTTLTRRQALSRPRPPNGRRGRSLGGTKVNAHQARREPACSSAANSGGYGASASRPIMS